MDESVYILVIDDDDMNIEIIEESLSDKGYKIISAYSGEEGISLLKRYKDKIHAVLLDWMMPGMNGLDCLSFIKSDESTADIPVIVQTANTNRSDITRGFDAGAYYYLTKPYSLGILYATVKVAVAEYKDFLQLKRTVENDRREDESSAVRKEFSFRTIDEGMDVLARISHFFPPASMVLYGLQELVKNAVEHGNLKISYEEKAKLLAENKFDSELNRRLASDEYKDKEARLILDISGEEICVSIEDEGDGFDYKKFLSFDEDRIFDLNGRGIALTIHKFGCNPEYSGRGNKVCVRIPMYNNY